MSDNFIGEIRIFPFNFAPKGWAMCDGQLMPISQNTALFSLLGTTYGGDGKSNFALPNLMGLAPMQAGQGPGLSLRDLGEAGGEQTVTLLASEMPAHNHSLQAFVGRGSNVNTPGPAVTLSTSPGNFVYDSATPNPPTAMAQGMLSMAGGSQPHNNLMPYLTLNFCIALQGIFPARS
jgi:microcystin-dependent protein